jgi:hypothetical protein
LGGNHFRRVFANRAAVLVGLGMFCRTDHGGLAPVELGVDHVVVTDDSALAVT